METYREEGEQLHSFFTSALDEHERSIYPRATPPPPAEQASLKNTGSLVRYPETDYAMKLGSFSLHLNTPISGLPSAHRVGAVYNAHR